jgi:CO dehydrogenase/acetyl-CoA synthase beta subunit
MIMSYTLRQVKAGWEIQNGSSITVTVPDLKSVELAIEMLTRKPEPAVKKAASKKVEEEEEEEEEEGEETSPKDALTAVLNKSKKALTAKEIIDRINPEADEAEVKNFHQILSTLGKSKVLKRKKNEHNIFAYSVK